MVLLLVLVGFIGVFCSWWCGCWLVCVFGYWYWVVLLVVVVGRYWSNVLVVVGYLVIVRNFLCC